MGKTAKGIRLYDVIFPIWLILLIPPVIFIALAANFVVDTIVILIIFALIKDRTAKGYSVPSLYRKSILKVWLLGFAADIISAVSLTAVTIVPGILPDTILSAVCGNPFTDIRALLIVLFFVAVAGVLLFLFNYHITFKRIIREKALKFKISIAIAVVTAPWTFLIPTMWLYKGY
jgi:hypothetical protein